MKMLRHGFLAITFLGFASFCLGVDAQQTCQKSEDPILVESASGVHQAPETTAAPTHELGCIDATKTAIRTCLLGGMVNGENSCRGDISRAASICYKQGATSVKELSDRLQGLYESNKDRFSRYGKSSLQTAFVASLAVVTAAVFVALAHDLSY